MRIIFLVYFIYYNLRLSIIHDQHQICRTLNNFSMFILNDITSTTYVWSMTSSWILHVLFVNVILFITARLLIRFYFRQRFTFL